MTPFHWEVTGKIIVASLIALVLIASIVIHFEGE
jgi:hypothetical protein